MPLEIIREESKPRLVVMGRADQTIEPVKAEAAAVPIPAPTLQSTNVNRGRKKMADKKLDHESGGPETIRQDDADEQGAIGSHGENAPAQQKVPESDGKEGE